MTKIPSIAQLGPIPGRSCLRSKLYPNGEVAIWKEKTYKPSSIKALDKDADAPAILALWRLCGNPMSWIDDKSAALGSSPLPNSDSPPAEGLGSHEAEPGVVARYGANGITSYGARRVRNGCYVLEKNAPKFSTVFSTCTVPALPVEDMRLLHERWYKVVETFRRKLTRHLRHQGLSGESVSVSEIQSKRYERTGIPVLHLHTVFAGRTKSGKVAVSKEAHDNMWRDALMVGVCGPVVQLRSACNLQWVKKSAESYLGKYMSKGTQIVRELCEGGFEGWLPKQWWSMTRSLGKRIDDQTRRIDGFAEWLSEMADIEGGDIWQWHRDVRLKMASGDEIVIARYGKLSAAMRNRIQQYYSG